MVSHSLLLLRISGEKSAPSALHRFVLAVWSTVGGLDRKSLYTRSFVWYVCIVYSSLASQPNYDELKSFTNGAMLTRITIIIVLVYKSWKYACHMWLSLSKRNLKRNLQNIISWIYKFSVCYVSFIYFIFLFEKLHPTSLLKKICVIK